MSAALLGMTERLRVGVGLFPVPLRNVALAAVANGLVFAQTGGQLLAAQPIPCPEDLEPSPGSPVSLVSGVFTQWDGRWYLIAFDLDRDDWRIFRLDRMRLRTPGGRRAAPLRLHGVGGADRAPAR